MQHQTAIYSPTTSQRLAATARKARLLRLGSLPPIPNEQIRNACEIASLLTVQEPALPPVPMGVVEKIQRAVIAHFPDVTLNDLKAARRDAVVVRPRQIAMYLAKQLTQQSLPEIGRRFGGRDHTTILHAVRKIKGKIATDAALAADIEAIKSHISEMR